MRGGKATAGKERMEEVILGKEYVLRSSEHLSITNTSIFFILFLIGGIWSGSFDVEKRVMTLCVTFSILCS